jgi:hypothetical protein
MRPSSPRQPGPRRGTLSLRHIPGGYAVPATPIRSPSGTGEVAGHEACRRPPGAHPALAAEALGLLQGGLDIGNADIEDHMAFVARASADAARDPGPVGGRDAVHEAISSSAPTPPLRPGSSYRTPIRTGRRSSSARTSTANSGLRNAFGIFSNRRRYSLSVAPPAALQSASARVGLLAALLALAPAIGAVIRIGRDAARASVLPSADMLDEAQEILMSQVVQKWQQDHTDSLA